MDHAIAIADAPPPERRRSVAFGALAVFTFVLLLAPQTIFPLLGSLRIALVAIAVAAAAVVFEAPRGRRVALPRGAGPAVALGAWALATSPLSYWPGGSVGVFTDQFGKSLVVFCLLPLVVDERDRLGRLVGWLAGAGAILGATALWNWTSGAFVPGGAGGDVRRIAGFDAPLTGNPNDLALMLNLLLPLTLARRSAARGAAARAALAVVAAIEAAGVLATFSRAGFLCLGFVLVAWALRELRGLGRTVAAAVVPLALIAAASVPSGYAQHMSTVLDIDADSTGSAQARWGEVVAALSVIASHPLVGAGLGMDILPITAETGGWRGVHNVYLQYAADLGLPGLCAFLVLLVGCAKAARAARGHAPDDDVGALAKGIELSLWTFAVAALFHPAGYHFYFYYVGGLALAVRSIRQKEVAA